MTEIEDAELPRWLRRLLRRVVMEAYEQGRSVAEREAYLRGVADGVQFVRSGADLGFHIPEETK